MMLSKKLTGMIEKADYSIDYEDGNIIDFGKYSSAGQDFHFSVDTENNLDYFLHNILERYMDFDVSYEASLWLDETGHGKNGAPYEMNDVYADMEECQQFIMDLYNIVDKYIKSIRRSRKVA